MECAMFTFGIGHCLHTIHDQIDDDLLKLDTVTNNLGNLSIVLMV